MHFLGKNRLIEVQTVILEHFGIVYQKLVSCSSKQVDFVCFVGYDHLMFMLQANLVFLSMAIYMMCRHANASASMKSKEHSRLASAR